MSVQGRSADSHSGAEGNRHVGPSHRDPRPACPHLSGRVLCLAWLALVAIGVFGRVWQPAYGVSPLVGIGLCAGALFPSLLVAASVPVVALAVSNLTLPGGGSYGSWTMAAIVFAAFAWPVLMGGLVRKHRLLGAAGGALAGSLAFFLVTNVAHWWLTSDYQHTLSGLAECFVAALPFYRWMPVGDLVWSVGLTAGMMTIPAVAGRFLETEVA